MGGCQQNKRDITRLLKDASQGKQDAIGFLIPLVYEELRGRAARLLTDERKGHTLQPTDLVHDAWIKIAGLDSIEWTDRMHFFRVSAGCMRRILVDHARSRVADKRGGGARSTSLTALAPATYDDPAELLFLDEALEDLGKLDPRLAEIVELRLFSGLSAREVGEALQVSSRTVERDLRLARAWFQRRLDAERPRDD